MSGEPSIPPLAVLSITRFFYPASRAHHAYGMAIDFGMKFKKRDGFWTPEGLLTVTGASGYEIEIADDSLDLLKPQVGDRLSDGYIVVWNYPSPKTYQRRLYLAESDIQKGLYGIIQRNGVAFQWPDSSPV